jgi:antitoxin component of MazEF toxin-antitoxin module
MTKKFRKVGNSQCITIDKPVLDLVGVTLETELVLSTDGQSILARPVSTANRKPGRPPAPPTRLTKTLTKVGNSHMLYVDKPVLELLSIDNETEIEIYTDGNALLLTPLGAKVEAAAKIGEEIDFVVANEKQVPSRSVK